MPRYWRRGQLILGWGVSLSNAVICRCEGGRGCKFPEVPVFPGAAREAFQEGGADSCSSFSSSCSFA